MHFSLPNNRPLEQGGHWEEGDCNLVHQTPKLPAIISSFLYQTDLQWLKQNLSCDTREIYRTAHFLMTGEICSPRHMESLHTTGARAVKSAFEQEGTASFSSWVVSKNKSLGWRGNNTALGHFSNRVVKQAHNTLFFIKITRWLLKLLIYVVFRATGLK